MVAEITRLTESQMLRRAATGLGKVDAYGLRGASLISLDEIEAMAALLAICGLTPIAPGPETRPPHITVNKERPDAL